MAEKPEWVRDFERPQGTETRHIRGHWYPCERKWRLRRERISAVRCHTSVLAPTSTTVLTSTLATTSASAALARSARPALGTSPASVILPRQRPPAFRERLVAGS